MVADNAGHVVDQGALKELSPFLSPVRLRQVDLTENQPWLDHQRMPGQDLAANLRGFFGSVDSPKSLSAGKQGGAIAGPPSDQPARTVDRLAKLSGFKADVGRRQ